MGYTLPCPLRSPATAFTCASLRFCALPWQRWLIFAWRIRPRGWTTTKRGCYGLGLHKMRMPLSRCEKAPPKDTTMMHARRFHHHLKEMLTNLGMILLSVLLPALSLRGLIQAVLCYPGRALHLNSGADFAEIMQSCQGRAPVG